MSVSRLIKHALFESSPARKRRRRAVMTGTRVQAKTGSTALIRVVMARMARMTNHRAMELQWPVVMGITPCRST
jgi:hypothetical protein